MDICRNQTLNEVFKRKEGKVRMRESEVRGYLLQLVQGLKYIHGECVVHRDLKLRNLFLTDEMQLKIGDFGLAAKVEEGVKRRTVCGTPNYMSPEVLNAQVGHSYETDVWSVGVIMYVLIIGRAPFQAPSSKLIYSRIKTGIYIFPKDAEISDAAKDLITKMLNPNPAKRLTLDQILGHDFIANSDITKPIMNTSQNISITNIQQRIVTPLIRKSTLANKEKVVDRTFADRRVAERLLPLAALKTDVESINPSISKTVNKVETEGSEIWIKKWIDYSSKYGLGYVTTKGCVGVFFNDFTKIALHSDRQYSFKTL
eukprot:TRINITY_DN16802_c0_g2_i4.p1 TRINITY_DN16802_c0_g2~~TRINITY_DN16802_c0_g2_i4.p1  ORF type:complete len:314 (-),score=48.97 TRINITY_DN16802_c0_g2_i4:541-1482(-)